MHWRLDKESPHLVKFGFFFLFIVARSIPVSLNRKACADCFFPCATLVGIQIFRQMCSIVSWYRCCKKKKNEGITSKIPQTFVCRSIILRNNQQWFTRAQFKNSKQIKSNFSNFLWGSKNPNYNAIVINYGPTLERIVSGMEVEN